MAATSNEENKKPEYAGVCIKIKTVDNGVVVTAYPENDMGPRNETTHVFETLEKALKEVPGIISVTKTNAKESPKNRVVVDSEDY